MAAISDAAEWRALQRQANYFIIAASNISIQKSQHRRKIARMGRYYFMSWTIGKGDKGCGVDNDEELQLRNMRCGVAENSELCPADRPAAASNVNKEQTMICLFYLFSMYCTALMLLIMQVM